MGTLWGYIVLVYFCAETTYNSLISYNFDQDTVMQLVQSITQSHPFTCMTMTVLAVF